MASGDQNTGASVSVLPMNIQGGSPATSTGLISLLSKRLSGVFASLSVQRHQFFGALPSLLFQLSQPFVTTGKTIALSIWTFVGRAMSLLFNTLSRSVIAFLPISNCLPISGLQSPSTLILEPKKRNLSLLPPFPILFAVKGWDQMP